MNVEEEIGQTIPFTDSVRTVQDLYECVEQAV